MIVYNLNHIEYVKRKQLIKEEALMEQTILKPKMTKVKCENNGFLE